MASKTDLQRRKDAAQKRAELREQGICLICAKRPVGKNQDGSISCRCEECREKLIGKHSSKVTAANAGKRSDRMHIVDDEVSQSEIRYYAELLAHSNRVKKIIRAADKKGGEHYRGLTLNEIDRRLGIHANKTRTLAALRSIEVHEARLIPERYSLMPPKVKYVDKHLWGTVASVPGVYKFDGNALPDFEAVMSPRNVTA